MTMALALAFEIGGATAFDTARGRWAAAGGLTLALIAGVDASVREWHAMRVARRAGRMRKRG